MLSILLPLFLCVSLSLATPDQPQLTFEDFYQSGKNEYTVSNWPDCVAFMRRAVEDFRYLEDELVFCRRKCNGQIRAASDVHYLSWWHSDSEKALCVMRCKRDRFTEDRPETRKMSTVFDMMERKPYEYMHICYWKMGDLSLAVQSAYTFLVRNSDSKDALHALSFYMEQPGYDDDMLVDALRMPHETLFISGVAAYDEGDWGRCVNELELSIEKIMEQDQRCRLLCEDKVDWSVVNGNPDLATVVTSLRSSILRCQHHCLHRLSVINGRSVGHPIAAAFEYLHYCYYKQMRGTDAARVVAGYLLFDDSPLMRRNKHFYLEQYGKEELFQPDAKILEFHRQREMEKRYLKFVDEKFRYENNEFPPEQADDSLPLDVSLSVSDPFPYSLVVSLLSPSECSILRSPLPHPLAPPLLAEIQKRLVPLWPRANYSSTVCGPTAIESTCPRPVVLSLESDDCSQWLGKWHTGCAIEFCV